MSHLRASLLWFFGGLLWFFEGLRLWLNLKTSAPQLHLLPLRSSRPAFANSLKRQGVEIL
jgi:hypothetical protein